MDKLVAWLLYWCLLEFEKRWGKELTRTGNGFMRLNLDKNSWKLIQNGILESWALKTTSLFLSRLLMQCFLTTRLTFYNQQYWFVIHVISIFDNLSFFRKYVFMCACWSEVVTTTIMVTMMGCVVLVGRWT